MVTRHAWISRVAALALKSERKSRLGECSLTVPSSIRDFGRTPLSSRFFYSCLHVLNPFLHQPISFACTRTRSLASASERTTQSTMASKKRKSAEASSTSPGKRTPAGSRPQRLKPSVEVVEVSSDSDDEETYKAGPERGLSRQNRLDASSQQSVEQFDDEEDETTTKKSRHMTRGSRHGRADNRKCYNMKCT